MLQSVRQSWNLQTQVWVQVQMLSGPGPDSDRPSTWQSHKNALKQAQNHINWTKIDHDMDKIVKKKLLKIVDVTEIFFNYTKSQQKLMFLSLF